MKFFKKLKSTEFVLNFLVKIIVLLYPFRVKVYFRFVKLAPA